MATHPEDLRARLEDRADLLEATRLRYRALKGLLEAFFWKDRLRADVELLREVATAQPEVDAALVALQRRAAAEGWPRGSSPVKLMEEVERLREAVRKAVLKRLPDVAPADALGSALLRLETVVLDAGPLLGRREWARAVELLPRNLPELRAACAAGEVFERVFKRPVAEGALPFTSAEADELARALPLANAALTALWERLARFDVSGRVKDFLLKRARRAPQRVARSGPELLLHAAFWCDVARARVQAVLEAWLSPVVPREFEVPALLSWLAARESSSEARLPSGEDFTEGRAGLYEVAAALASLSRARPVGVWNEEAAWARLDAAARRARDEQGPEVEELREQLRLFIRLRGQSRTPARLFSPERARVPVSSEAESSERDDLPALARAARQAALRPG
ncbi:hypothetical protein JGU66_07165 [Myxococcaceae bacterium JPH2]|nr:hypothetical protein [Myxococcaceae bacterium JPH2]